MRIKQIIGESFIVHDVDPDAIYDAFKKSYESQTGAAWSKEKFLSRTQGWTFYGDENGFLSVRIQRGGMKKLVGAAGDPRSILKGLTEFQAEGGPIWGAMSAPLAAMAKKRGMIVPHTYMGGPFFIKTLLPLIPASVFGGVEPKVTGDGGIVSTYDDVGAATKYLVGNKAYFASAVKMPEIAQKITEVPGLKTFLKLIALGVNESLSELSDASAEVRDVDLWEAKRT